MTSTVRKSDGAANWPKPANTLAARLARATVRGFEAASLRGAPTIMRALSKVPLLQGTTATARVGRHLFTFPAYDEYWCRYLWACVPYERDVEQIFRKLANGRILVDCGANIGYWSVRAPEFGFTRIIAIEANPRLMWFLRENLRLNCTNATAIEGAVYRTSGEHLFLDHTEAHAQAGVGDKGVPVESIAIADVVKDIPRACEIVVKLDVEGAEIAAMEGAGRADDKIFVYEDFAEHGMRVTKYALARGMAIFGVAPSGRYRRLQSLEDAYAFNKSTAIHRAPSNLIACSPERATSLELELSS